MKNHLNLTKDELNWLILLSNTTTDKQLINFIVNLDDTYKGAGSYLSLTELPGYCLTNALANCEGSHPKFQLKTFQSALGDMPFFKVGLRLVGLNGEKWNPTNETIKAFATRHAKDEVIYYENQYFYETVSYFQSKFGELTNTVQRKN